MSIVNHPPNVCDESIAGFLWANPHVTRLANCRVLCRTDIDEYKTTHVTLISGGGSGHEPAHGGYIGEGMLSAVVCGDVFASPPASAVLEAIRKCAGPMGTLLIVKNYTGDRLHFGMAAERAKLEGILVHMVVVGDDCAVPAHVRGAGRRGLAGTVLVHKIAGAISARGSSLVEVAATAQTAADSIGTMSVSLSSCTVPGRPASFELPVGYVELGLGIHGEPGIRRQLLAPCDTLLTTMINTVLEDERFQDGAVGSDGRFVHLSAHFSPGTLTPL